MSQVRSFDVNGTLIASIELHTRGWRAAFHDFGRTVGCVAVHRDPADLRPCYVDSPLAVN